MTRKAILHVDAVSLICPECGEYDLGYEGVTAISTVPWGQVVTCMCGAKVRLPADPWAKKVKR